jgi:dihydropteroate synthase
MNPLNARLGNVYIGDKCPVAVMGVINLDPHSFYPLSYYPSRRRAVSAAEKMIEENVDILDIGGVSTAPGSSSISVEEEIRRIKGVIKAITRNWDIPVSIDTQRAQVAKIALANGATIINDVSGLKFDATMASTIQDAGASCVIMASEFKPGDQNTVSNIISSLRTSLRIAQRHGISKDLLAIDPGLGFGKPIKCDLNIIRNLKALRVLNQPIILGVSRKNFIGQVLGYSSPNDRLYGSLAVSTIAILEGVHTLRTHDIRAIKDSIKMVTAIQSSHECE